MINISITDDLRAVREILIHPDIYPLISTDDGPESEFYFPTLGENVFILGKINGKPMALLIGHPCNERAWWVHVQVLPEYRKDWAFHFGGVALDLMWRFTGAIKFMALIPDIYPNVARFAERCGFVAEGCLTNSIMKGGRACNQLVFGLSRPSEV